MLYTDEAIKRRKNRSNRTRKIISIIVYIVLMPLLIYNISLILQAMIIPDKTPAFMGIKTYVIISGSMQPELNIGDIVATKNIKEEELKIGDIISFRQGQNVITHRISGINELEGKKQYKTKGDNNNTDDSGTIEFELIEGRVITKIPYIGNILLLLQGKLTIIVIALIVYIYIYYTGNTNAKKERRRLKRLRYEEKKGKMKTERDE